MIQETLLRKAVFFAALVMLLPLPIMQYVGEESWYTLSAYEMFVNHKWWHQTLMGFDLAKTPLFNWLIIAVAEVIGWQHLEIAPRIISVLSTWGSAFVVYKMARRFFPQRMHTPWLAALIYLTMGEVSFWYGWLGYADASFGFFIFSAIACLWIAIEDEKLTWFLTSLLLITLAFMIKNSSCYAIFGLAGIVLLQRHHRWRLLLNPLFVIPGLLALAVPWAYPAYIIKLGSNGDDAIAHALLNFTGFGIFDYIYHWISYPVLFIARAFPVTLLLIWFFWREKQRYSMDNNMLTLLWILLICLAPFWFSAGGTPRYLIPFYGIFALLLTGFTLQLDHKKMNVVFKTMLVIIILKIPFSFAVLPYIKDWRPERDIKVVVEDILQTTADKTVRTRNNVSTGLSIMAYMDVRMPPEQHIRWYDGKERQVFILSYARNADFGTVVKSYRLRGNDVFLYWQP